MVSTNFFLLHNVKYICKHILRNVMWTFLGAILLSTKQVITSLRFDFLSQAAGTEEGEARELGAQGHCIEVLVLTRATWVPFSKKKRTDFLHYKNKSNFI